MFLYIVFWFRMLRCALTGRLTYWSWLIFLSSLVFLGLYHYGQQIEHGLIVTNMSDQVSWGAYIANFTFLVGIAAAAVLLVFSAYVTRRKDIKEVVIIGELMAVSAIIMCLLFVFVDMGRPDRFWHILPFIGRMNFPDSMLAWDVLVLNGYLLLNLHIPGYILYRKYLGKKNQKAAYLPFVYLSIFWAISIHTVTAFLYSGLGGRHFWNSSILAPRFLISAFASGPSFLIIALYVLKSVMGFEVKASVFSFLRKTISIALPINFFLLGSEVFVEFYPDTMHSASAEYLFFGLHGHHMVAPYIWSSIVLNLSAMTIFLVPSLFRRWSVLLTGSVFCIVGIWIEKGMGLIIPGFIPTPLGDLVEYVPSSTEFFICLGIWSLGTLIFTLMSKVAVSIEMGKLYHKSNA